MRFQMLFPTDGSRINVRCGTKLFNGHVDRENNNGAVRLCFNLGYNEVNDLYNEFMENIGEGAELCFRAVDGARNVIILDGDENNGAIQELFLETINFNYE